MIGDGAGSPDRRRHVAVHGRKTRLALEAAARRIDRYPHGVHFVPLVSVASPEFLAPAVAESIQFAVDGAHSGFSAQEQLLDYLGERSTLLVLDNFEHLVDGADLLGTIIERALTVELLTTSRERLHVQSEWVLDVHGLGLAENGNGCSGALQLFVESAMQVEPGFSRDDAFDEALRICRLVEGLPLDIELAASWVSLLSCAEIADEIERNIDSLPRRCAMSRSGIAASAHLQAGRGLAVGHRARRLAVADADLRLLSDLVSKFFFAHSWFDGAETFERLAAVASEAVALAAVAYRTSTGSALGYDEGSTGSHATACHASASAGWPWSLPCCQ